MADKNRDTGKTEATGGPPARENARETNPEKTDSAPFPVVGLGASAGGLAALKSFFAAVSEDAGMAYVVMVHMPPKQPSILPELLQQVSDLPVAAAADGQALEPGRVYVIPPDRDAGLLNGVMQLSALAEETPRLPIDAFFRSLALDRGNLAAAVVLSGTGTDGTLGIKEIKACDGLVLVQTEDTAGYDGMPGSAKATGLADLVLPPGKMPENLVRYFGRPHRDSVQMPAASAGGGTWLPQIFAILRTRVGHDFSGYKANTLLRRISRRMGLNHIPEQETYVRFLRENPGEVEALFKELLIGVTGFFRDPESFRALKARILPVLTESLADNTTFRVWVPGCSTGEEVYSLAIILREHFDDSVRRMDLQIFGTDIDADAIERAREGLYPAGIAEDVGPERLKRFFSREGDFYRIRKEIRDCAVFSVQNILKDPPFSKLHMLCCRNLLIYLETRTQKKILPLFHYTLRPDGLLILGSSETIGGFGRLFETLDKKWKIFRRQEVPQALRQMVDFPSGLAAPHGADKEALPPAAAVPLADIGRLTRSVILDRFAPTAILTDAKGEMLHIQGRTGKYLETPSGPPTQNILDLAREGLRIELSSALRAARSSGDMVTRQQLSVRTNGDRQLLNLHVLRLAHPKELAGRLLVVLEDIPPSGDLSDGEPRDWGSGTHASARILELEKELQITRESHQTTIEELESSNEELKSTNEEMQSSNEELQSTNEELESSKEELQSLNEELQTVNAELQSKVEELSAAHDDMRNLLNSTEIATIFVDNHMRIRRFTTEATRIVNLIQTDIGRPLKHVVSNLAYAGMMENLAEVLKRLSSKEAEVRTRGGEWFQMRIIPYRTTDNRIDGAVLTFSNINDQKKVQAGLADSQRLVSAIFEMNDDPMAVLDQDGNLVLFNKKFSDLVMPGNDPPDGSDVLSLVTDTATRKELGEKLAASLNQSTDFRLDKVPLGKAVVTISATVIEKDRKFPYRILLRLNAVR